MGVFRTKPFEIILSQETGRRALKRSLRWFDLTALGVGAIVGTGIFVLTGVGAARFAGPGVMLSFVLAGLVAGMAALVYAELAAMVPVAGSAYTYAYASLGEIVAWIIGWDLALEYAVAGGAVAIGWSSYLVDLLASAGISLPPSLVLPPALGGIVNLPAMAIVAALTTLVALGTRGSARFNSFVVTLKIAVVLFFLVVGARFVNPANWRPFLPFGYAGVVNAAAIVFFAYIGFDVVATTAEEVRKPGRDLPIGILGSLLVASVLYLGVTAVLTGMVPYPRLDTASPVAFALLDRGQRLAAAIVSAGAEMGLMSVILAVIYAQSRVFFSMARDGLLPPVFARLHRKFRTPVLATVLVGGVSMLVGGFLPIVVAAELVNIGTLSAFILVSTGVVVLRRTRPAVRRPFRCPWVPVLPVLVILFSLYLMSRLPATTWLRFGVWLVIGLGIYFLYGRRQSVMARTTGKKGRERAASSVVEEIFTRLGKGAEGPPAAVAALAEVEAREAAMTASVEAGTKDDKVTGRLERERPKEPVGRL